jgi:hypothetical protein
VGVEHLRDFAVLRAPGYYFNDEPSVISKQPGTASPLGKIELSPVPAKPVLEPDYPATTSRKIKFFHRLNRRSAHAFGAVEIDGGHHV